MLSISSKNKAFTLIELLIVVGVIGILTGVVITVINPKRLQGKARDAVRIKDLSIIKGALEQYYSEHNEYPPESSVVFGNPLTDATGNTIYLKSLPHDPKYPDSSWNDYCYTRTNPGDYILCAQVEIADSANNPPNSCITANNVYCVWNPF